MLREKRAASVVLFAVAACGTSDGQAPWVPCEPVPGATTKMFRDITAASGVDFAYATDGIEAGALAVADLDGDNQPEIIAASRNGGFQIFKNLGGLRFEKQDSGIEQDLVATAIAAADFDNDGDIDLVIAEANVTEVFQNRGNGTFDRIATLADTGTTEQILPVDLNNDGILDLYFSNYDLYSLSRTTNRVFMGGPQLTFAHAVDVGAGFTWATTALDIDGDGDRDLYVANDTLLPDFGGTSTTQSSLRGDLLLRNDGVDANGVPQFTDIAGELGMNAPRSSMGGSLADFDGDGMLDLFVTNWGAKKIFSGGATYTDIAPSLGLADPRRIDSKCPADSSDPACLYMSWSAAPGDFDLDGNEDVIIANGETELDHPVPMTLYMRDGPNAYGQVTPELACMDARTVLAEDLDGDGDQDLVVSPKAGALLVIENQTTPTATNWLQVALRGSTSNRDGIGAIITLHTTRGSTQIRAIGAGGVLEGSPRARAYFGLGNDTVERVDVAWPSGKQSTVTSPRGTMTVDEN